jgi:hypothetical protein
MKGILIDPYSRSVEVLESEFELLELHKLVGAECLDFCYPFGRTEELAVADDGMDRQLPAFYIEGYRWPIWGRAVLTGLNAGGKARSTRLSVEEVYDRVRFP